MSNTPPTIGPRPPGRNNISRIPNRPLNSPSGPTRVNPANPVQVNPPPTSPISRLPPKIPTPPKGPGLGLLTVIKPNIPSLLLLGGLFLLSWWLSQPAPPPVTTPPPNPVFQLNPLKSYLVEIDTEIQVDGTNYRGSVMREVLSGASGVTFPVFFGSSLLGMVRSGGINRLNPYLTRDLID